MIDADKLQAQLTVDNIRSIVISLGGIIYSEDSETIKINTICHNRTGGKPKLWFNKQYKTFRCWTECAETFNIFRLVIKRKRLLGEEYTFPQALEYCCDVCHIPYESAQRVTKKTQVYDWKKDIEKYLRSKSSVGRLKIYDKSILNFFPKIYHLSWLEFGISIETLEKYHICYYPYRSQIVIPSFDEFGDLIGIRIRNLLPNLVADGKKYMPLFLANGTQFNFPTNAVLYGLNHNKETIKRKKAIILCEAEKSVLKLDTWYGEESIGVATFGSALGKYRRNKILELGVEEVIIAIDWDYHEYGDAEYEKYEKKVYKIAREFRGFCNVSVLCSHGGHEYKSNAFDYDKELFEECVRNKEYIDWGELDE